MASYDLDEIIALTQNTKRCYETSRAILSHYFKCGVSFVLPRDDWEDLCDEEQSEKKTYSQYVVEKIEQELNRTGLVGVELENGTGCDDKTFDHHYVLIRKDDDVYRVESYVDCYTTRIVKNPTYAEDLINLLSAKAGQERINLWNSIFSSQEAEDTTEPSLDVVLKIRCL